jgi:MFS family permease
MNLPGYEFLPAPVWLITALHILTLTLHFTAMNILLGGVIVILLGRFGDRWSQPIVKRIVRLLPTVMAATVTLGVAPLLFAQLIYHRQLYAAAIVSGWFWLLIIVAAIAAYYLLYTAALAAEGSRRTRFVVPIALVPLLYIAFVYSSVFSMAERPGLVASLYAAHQGGGAINADVSSWLWRWLHMIAGAVTVGAFFLGIFGRDDSRFHQISRRFLLWGLILSAVLGVIFLLAELDYLKPLMHSAGIWALAASFVLSLGSLHLYFKRRFAPAATLMFLSLGGMVFLRHMLRLIHLEGRLDPEAIPVQPQWTVFVLFLIFFVVALGTVGWMLRVYFRSGGAAETEWRRLQ